MPPAARTIDAWEQVVGGQVRDLRIRSQRTQAELAVAANVSLSAVQALELGKGSRLATLVAVVRALGRTEWLEELAPPVPISPLALAREQRRAGPGRQRVRHAAPRPEGEPEIRERR